MELHLPDLLPIRSRVGQWVITILGAIIALAAAGLLIYSLVTTWGYAGMIDHLIRLVLAGEIVIGGLFAIAAYRKLKRGND